MIAPEQGLTTTVYTVSPEATVSEVVQLMVSQGVGDVIVTEGRRPVGILTDRDIVVRVLGAGLDAQEARVREVMSQPLVTVTRDEDISTAIALMQFHGIRRLPIMDGDGRLVSILTLDDIQLLGLSDQPELAEILQQQLCPQENQVDPPPATGSRPIEQKAPPMKIAIQSTGNASLSASIATISRPFVVVPMARTHHHHHVLSARRRAVRDWFDRNLFWVFFLLLLTLGVVTVYFLTSYLGKTRVTR